MDPIKISFKKDDQVVWCPHGPNIGLSSTSSTSSYQVQSSSFVPPVVPPVVVVNSTITTNTIGTSSWSSGPVMCTGVWGPTRPPRRGLDGVVLQVGEEWNTPVVQVQFSDGWVEKIFHPEEKIRSLEGCTTCPYRLYRITGECPNDPDLIKNEGQGV